MALSDILNMGACGASAQKGFNTTKGCAIPFKDVDEIWFTPSDFEFDGTQDFTEEYVKSVQEAGDLIVLKDVQSFEAQNTDNQFSTNQRGYKELALDGIYEYKAVFNEDIWFNKQLGALEGKRRWRAYLVSKGAIYGTESSDSLKGFLAYSITRSLQTFTQGTEVAMQALEIQFADKTELDDKPVVLGADTLSFSTNDIEPIVQAYLSFNSIPTSSSTTIGVKAVLDRGMKGFISGLTNVEGFTVEIDGVSTNYTGVISVDGTYYELTLNSTPSAGKTVSVYLNGVQNIDGDCLYVSNKASEKVAIGL